LERSFFARQTDHFGADKNLLETRYVHLNTPVSMLTSEMHGIKTICRSSI